MATSAAGETVAGRALVGADGLWSTRARRPFAPSAAAVRWRDRHAHRDPGRQGAGAWPSLRSACGSRRACTSCTIRCARGSEIAVVVIAREDWRGPRVGRGGRPQPRCSHSSSASTPASTDVLAPVRPVAQMGAPSPRCRCPAGRRARIGLIGDAAHPMLPYLAQGGVLGAGGRSRARRTALPPMPARRPARSRFETLPPQARDPRAGASLRQGRIYHLPHRSLGRATPPCGCCPVRGSWPLTTGSMAGSPIREFPPLVRSATAQPNCFCG